MNEVSELSRKHIIKACQKYKGGQCTFGDYIIIFVSKCSEHQWHGDISSSSIDARKAIDLFL